MKEYRVNKNTNNNPGGHNEVHNQDCKYYDLISSYEELGYHPNCHTAVADAKRKGYPKADGCKECSNECHNG